MYVKGFVFNNWLNILLCIKLVSKHKRYNCIPQFEVFHQVGHKWFAQFKCVCMCVSWQSEGRPSPAKINELRTTLINDSKPGTANLSLLCHSLSSHSSSGLFWSVDWIACAWPITAQPLPKPTTPVPIKILTALIESNVGHAGSHFRHEGCKYVVGHWWFFNYTCKLQYM